MLRDTESVLSAGSVAKKSSGFEAKSAPAASVVGRGARFGRRLWLVRRVVHGLGIGELVGTPIRLLGPVALPEFLDRARLGVVMTHDNYCHGVPADKDYAGTGRERPNRVV